MLPQLVTRIVVSKQAAAPLPNLATTNNTQQQITQTLQPQVAQPLTPPQPQQQQAPPQQPTTTFQPSVISALAKLYPSPQANWLAAGQQPFVPAATLPDKVQQIVSNQQLQNFQALQGAHAQRMQPLLPLGLQKV